MCVCVSVHACARACPHVCVCVSASASTEQRSLSSVTPVAIPQSDIKIVDLLEAHVLFYSSVALLFIF